MSYSFYCGLKRVLHFNDNTSPKAKDNKCHKFRPLNSATAYLFNQHYGHGSHISIDEAVCTFQGRHSCKQYFGKSKPGRWVPRGDGRVATPCSTSLRAT